MYIKLGFLYLVLLFKNPEAFDDLLYLRFAVEEDSEGIVLNFVFDSLPLQHSLQG